MSIKIFSRALLFSVLVLALPGIASAAGHIAPHGVTNLGASQLVVWYDESQSHNGLEGFSYLQVTNGSADTGVNIHVQIFADDVFDSDDRCREHDFTDSLTPTDTVIYVIGELDNPDSSTPPLWGGNNAHAPIAIDVDETRGFIVVTAVNQSTLPRRAIAHNSLFGTLTTITCSGDCDGSVDETESAHGFNAMGRQAVDFATGSLTANGVLLDGITNGYRLLQPDFFMFGFNDEPLDEEASVISIAFADNYSDPNGEYRAEPATATWNPLMFDQFENGTSCQEHVLTCFNNCNLNDDWDSYIDEDGSDYTEVTLCPAASLTGEAESGWVDIAVSGLSGLDNNLGVIGLNEDDSSAMAAWMHSQ